MTVTHHQALAELQAALSPGPGRGRKIDGGVLGMPTHRIRLTRDTGKVDMITIYNDGAAWSEGHGDWPLADEQSETVRQWLAAAQAGNFE